MLLSSLEKSYSVLTATSQERSCLQWFFCLAVARVGGLEQGRGAIAALGKKIFSHVSFHVVTVHPDLYHKFSCSNCTFFFPYESSRVPLPPPVFRNMSQMLMPQILMQSLQINKNLFSRAKPEWPCKIWYTLDMSWRVQQIYCWPSLVYYDWLCIIEIKFCLHLKALTRSVYYLQLWVGYFL